MLEIEFVLLPHKRREFLQSFEMFTEESAASNSRVSLLQDRMSENHVLWVFKWGDVCEWQHYTECGPFRALMGGLRLVSNVLDCRVVMFGDDDLG
jgi:hypothetical protein